MERNPDGPTSRDYTNDFKMMRTAMRKRLDREIEKTLNLFQMLSFSTQTSENKSYWRKSARMITPVAVVDENNKTAQQGTCHLCGTNPNSFSKLIGKSLSQCPLCAQFVCKNCLSNEQLELDPLVGREQEPRVRVPSCVKCYTLVKKGKSKKAFKSLLELSPKNSFVILQKALHDMTEHIHGELRTFKHLVRGFEGRHTTTNTYDVERAKKMSKALAIMFDDLRKLSVKLNKIPAEPGTKAAILKANILNHFINYETDHKPQFSLLSKELNMIAALPPVEPPPAPPVVVHSNPNSNPSSNTSTPTPSKKLSFLNKVKAVVKGDSASSVTISSNTSASSYSYSDEEIDNDFRDGEEDLENQDSSSAYNIKDNQEENTYSDTAPAIRGITPAISGMSGGVPMRIDGDNFHPNLVLKIDNKKVTSIISILSDSIHFVSPSLDNSGDGFKPIEVINPNLEKAILENVLLYMSDSNFATMSGASTNNSNRSSSMSSSVEKRRLSQSVGGTKNVTSVDLYVSPKPLLLHDDNLKKTHHRIESDPAVPHRTSSETWDPSLLPLRSLSTPQVQPQSQPTERKSSRVWGKKASE